MNCCRVDEWLRPAAAKEAEDDPSDNSEVGIDARLAQGPAATASLRGRKLDALSDSQARSAGKATAITLTAMIRMT